jgi:hypothetical protein
MNIACPWSVSDVTAVFNRRGGRGESRTVGANINGALAVKLSNEVEYRRKRRGSVASCPLPFGAVVIAGATERRQVGVSARSPYQRTRARRLSPSERAAVLALAPYHTLRELAAEFGVSHETIRNVRKERERAGLA